MCNQVSLEEILTRRDQRAIEISSMLSGQKDCIVLSFCLNIPGPEKTSPKLREVGLIARREIETYFQQKGFSFSQYKYLDLKTGPEFMALIRGDGRLIKGLVVDLEEKSFLGRLYDLDVTSDQGLISRKDLGLKPRPCLICDQPAQLCARSRRHSLAELREAVSALIELCVNM